MFEENYRGSHLLRPLSNLIGLPLDQTNYIVCQIIALLISCFMRKYLHPSQTSASTRHAFSCFVGLFYVYFCFGSEIWVLLILSTFCYGIILKVDPKYSQNIVFVVSILYLAARHLERMIYSYGSYTLDITGPLMIMVQKTSGLAFSVHDGMAVKEENLTPYRKKYIVKSVPNILEFFGYLFQYQCILAGPNVFYTDYVNFINGDNFLQRDDEGKIVDKKLEQEPSPFYVVLKKILVSFTCIVIQLCLIGYFPFNFVKDERFLNSGFFYKVQYLMVSALLVRLMYFHAWTLADAICNASGFGFNGYDKNGEAKWDLTTNMDIKGFELGENLRSSISSWNLGTNMWLRFIVYERVKRNNTLLTFTLSALWHGFYPGYYITFSTAALFVVSARTVRKYIRPYFLDNNVKKIIYDVCTIVVTRLALTYFASAFILLEFWSSFRLYQSIYFFLHLGALLCFALPYIFRQKPKSSN